MTTELVREIEKEYLKSDLPELNPGDSVKVMVRIREGNKERLQGYEGVIVKLSGSGLTRTMTVRRVFQGVGVERSFLLHSPKVDSIKVLRRGRVRRARLYYLRERLGKAARIRTKELTAKEQEAEKEARKEAKKAAKKASTKAAAPEEAVLEQQQPAPEAAAPEAAPAPEAPQE